MSLAAHLVRRYFGYLGARPLSPREQSEVAALLTPGLAALFFSQQAPDQRHALEVAHRVLRARPGDRDLASAALLHDVGKRHSRLGATGRSLATLSRILGLPGTARMQSYLDHGPLGAADLAGSGADPLTVAFARCHPGDPPPGTDATAWDLLLDADHT